MKPKVERRISFRNRSGRLVISTASAAFLLKRHGGRHPAQEDPPRGGTGHAADHRQERGLAGAARPLEHRDLLRLDGQGDIIHGGKLVRLAAVEAFW